MEHNAKKAYTASRMSSSKKVYLEGEHLASFKGYVGDKSLNELREIFAVMVILRKSSPEPVRQCYWRLVC